MATGTFRVFHGMDELIVPPGGTNGDDLQAGLYQLNTQYTYYNLPYARGMVLVFGTNTARLQLHFPSTGQTFAFRYRTSSGWTSWYEFTGTAKSPVNTPT